MAARCICSVSQKALRGDSEAAEQLLRRAREIKTAAANILIDPGSILILRGNDRESADVLAKARRRDPQSPLAMFYHGVALTNLRRHDEALVIFDALVSQSPQVDGRETRALQQAVSLFNHGDGWLNR